MEDYTQMSVNQRIAFILKEVCGYTEKYALTSCPLYLRYLHAIRGLQHSER